MRTGRSRSTAEHAEHAETEKQAQVIGFWGLVGWSSGRRSHSRPLGNTPIAAAGEMINPPDLGVLGVLGV